MTGPLPKSGAGRFFIEAVQINKTTPQVCHSDRSASGAEESTTLEKEPTQGKTCYLRRFLRSLCSVGMTCRGVVPFCPHSLYSKRGMAMNHRRYIVWFHSTIRVVFATPPERHIGRSLRFRWLVYSLTKVFQKRIRPSP